MNEPKPSDRPITVNDSVTPITQQPVQQIDTLKWTDPNVSVSWLNNQLEILRERYAYASMHNPVMAQYIGRGIQQLSLIIEQRIEQQG